MKNFANFIPAILGILHLDSFTKVNGKEDLTETEFQTLKSFGFPDPFLKEFRAYLQVPKPSAKNANGSEDTRSAVIAAALGQVTAQHEAVSAELAELKKTVDSDKATHAAAIAAKEAEISALNEKIATLSKLPETDPGAHAGTGSGVAPTGFNIHDSEQLGGQPGVMFSLERPYNQRARAALLAREGMAVTVATAQAVDYTSLREDLGAFYRRPWTERIQSFLVELPTITKIFPTESGHQDLETLVNLFLGEFSQADSSNESDFDAVAKGSYEFGHETLRMYGVMFVHKFHSLKDLEKSWIGYLNREGSNPVKLSFIEYLLVETAKALHNEREQRQRWGNSRRRRVSWSRLLSYEAATTMQRPRFPGNCSTRSRSLSMPPIPKAWVRRKPTAQNSRRSSTPFPTFRRCTAHASRRMPESSGVICCSG